MSASLGFALTMLGTFCVGLLLCHLLYGPDKHVDGPSQIEDRARAARRELDQAAVEAQNEVYRQLGRAVAARAAAPPPRWTASERIDRLR